jgi:F0F1-type ATP synthase assembly protein I
LSIGAICGVMIGIGVFAGYLLDRAAGTSPLLTFLGLAFGILGAATGSYFVIRPYLKD